MTLPHLADALGHSASDKRLEILRRIAAGGSISQAARDAGVSYKAAWQALDTLTNLAGVSLVERVVGGTGGGGARVTQAGQQLLDTAAALEQARAQVLAQAVGGALNPARALALRTSMRNQWPCTVHSVVQLGRIWQIGLQLGQAPRPAQAPDLFSRITQESVELLGLAPGLPVLALCKATAVQVLPANAAVVGPGRNGLEGLLSRIDPGATPQDEDEVAVALQAGGQLAGFMAQGQRVPLHSPVLACLDASAVVIAAAS